MWGRSKGCENEKKLITTPEFFLSYSRFSGPSAKSDKKKIGKKAFFFTAFTNFVSDDPSLTRDN